MLKVINALRESLLKTITNLTDKLEKGDHVTFVDRPYPKYSKSEMDSLPILKTLETTYAIVSIFRSPDDSEVSYYVVDKDFTFDDQLVSINDLGVESLAQIVDAITSGRFYIDHN